MKVVLLARNAPTYSSNAYLVLGNWNRLDDVNTLVDVGADDSIIEAIEKSHTGVGKKKVDQVILTHNHFDHNAILGAIKERYGAKVYAFSQGPGVDGLLCDGQTVRMGDRNFEVLHMPLHSSDSICLYSGEEGVLFSGDTPIRIMTEGERYPEHFAKSIETLCEWQIKTIYSGHDKPLKSGVQNTLELTLRNVKKGMLQS
jgi:glyoxylase-like metal-dependent hydrolase (beta-lactamase superfamily II)